MILADTHVLLWAASNSRRLSEKARTIIHEASERRWFSAASVWEIAIKRARHRNFDVDVEMLRNGLRENGWQELGVTSEHAVAVLELPPIHKDPFDRMLLAQARVAGLTLLTSDQTVARYPGNVMRV